MRNPFHLLTNRNARWRYTNRIGFKLAMGCLGLIFIAACIGVLLVVYFMPAH